MVKLTSVSSIERAWEFISYAEKIHIPAVRLVVVLPRLGKVEIWIATAVPNKEIKALMQMVKKFVPSKKETGDDKLERG